MIQPGAFRATPESPHDGGEMMILPVESRGTSPSRQFVFRDRLMSCSVFLLQLNQVATFSLIICSFVTSISAPETYSHALFRRQPAVSWRGK